MGPILCPQCKKPANALNAEPHCKNQSCSWNKCKCGTTYSRDTCQGFGISEDDKPAFYPAST